MTIEEKINIKKARINILEARGTSFNIVRKLKRERKLFYLR